VVAGEAAWAASPITIMAWFAQAGRCAMSLALITVTVGVERMMAAAGVSSASNASATQSAVS
jgi:hypothetical protein